MCAPFNGSYNADDDGHKEVFKFYHDEIFAVINHMAKWVNKFDVKFLFCLILS